MTLALGVAGPVALIGTSSNLLIAGIAALAGIDMTMLSLAPVVLGAIVVESELAKVLADEPSRAKDERILESAADRVAWLVRCVGGDVADPATRNPFSEQLVAAALDDFKGVFDGRHGIFRRRNGWSGKYWSG